MFPTQCRYCCHVATHAQMMLSCHIRWAIATELPRVSKSVNLSLEANSSSWSGTTGSCDPVISCLRDRQRHRPKPSLDAEEILRRSLIGHEFPHIRIRCRGTLVFDVTERCAGQGRKDQRCGSFGSRKRIYRQDFTDNSCVCSG